MVKKLNEFEMKNTLASRLLQLRKASGISSREAQQLSGIPFGSLLEWERGETTPNCIKLAALADFYGVSMDYLLGRSDDERGAYTTFNFKNQKHRDVINMAMALKSDNAINTAYDALDAISGIEALTKKLKDEAV